MMDIVDPYIRPRDECWMVVHLDGEHDDREQKEGAVDDAVSLV
jgi:hypothetical protein